MRVVSPYRPFAPESQSHKLLRGFDWVDALRMLAISVARSNQCETLAITDVDTTLPVPALQFVTTERRLMLWMLEIALRYLESPAFDCDTVMVCPDTLVYGDLSPYFRGDLGLIVRSAEKYVKRPVLNSVQWWSVAAKDRLVPFFQEALAIAKTLDEHAIQWGADTIPLARLIAPIEVGLVARHGLSVHLIEMAGVMHSLSKLAASRVTQGMGLPSIPICDFKYLRKQHMRAVFQATLGQQVPA